MVASKLRYERFIRRLTQFRLAATSGVNVSRISLIENGLVEPRPHEKTALAQALGVKVSALFPRKEKVKLEAVGTADLAGV